MTRPLTFFLELTGAIILFAGLFPPTNYVTLTIGTIIFLIGAVGHRLRKI